MKNRFLSVVMAASLSFSMLPTAMAEDNSSPSNFVTDFESGDFEGWSFSGGLVTGSEMTYEEDADGNSFARIKIAKGTTVATADGTMDKTPNAAVVLDEPYYLEPSSTTVLSAKVRFSEIPATDLRIPLAVNIPSNFNKTSGLKSFWTWISGTGFVRTEKNSGATTDLNYLPTGHYGKYNYTSARNAMVAKSKLSADTWYTVKTTITADISGKPETVEYNIKGGNVNYSSGEQEVTQWSLLEDGNNKISTLNVVFDIRAALTDDFYYDIDDVIICKPEYEIELLNRVNGEIFIKNEYFDVKFGTDMDEDSLKNGVKLINKADDSEVEFEGEYLADEKIFRITPLSTLEDGGEYRIEIDEDVISPLSSGLKDIVTPITGDMNFQYFASEIPLPPIVSNVNVSGLNYVGNTLFAGYDYYHNTNEPEGDSEYTWYIGAGDYYEEIQGENDREYTIKSEDEGQFIKFSVKAKTKNSGLASEVVESPVFGPVISGLEETNMLLNPGFEEDTISPWEITNKIDDMEISLKDVAYSGNFAMQVGKKTENDSAWGQKINLKKNKTYIFSGFAKILENSNWSSFNAYPHWWKGVEEANLTRPYAEKEATLITKDSWSNVAGTVETAKDIEAYPSITCKPEGKSGYSYLVDDLYVGELEISDIEAEVPTVLNVPDAGDETVISLESAVINQLGNEAGLYDEEVTWSVSGGEGLVVDGDSLIVTDKAVSGDVMLIASCVPSYRGASQKRFDKGFKIKISADNSTPRVDDVYLTGTVSEGAELVLDYTFYQADGKADESVIKWFFSDSEKGTYKEIEGTEGLLSYKVTADKKDKFIKCKITPVSDGITGNVIESNVASPAKKPQAKNVKITKESSKGVYSDDILTGSFEFYDINGDKMAVSEYRWLRGDSKNGEFCEIEGADGLTYTVTDEDIKKFIVFEVTPVSENEPVRGSAVRSEALKGPALPEIRDISISKSGTKLTGKYEYYHEYGSPEGESRYEWIINDNIVSNEISYMAKAGDEITFRVYPVSKDAPFEGEYKETTIKLPKKSSSGGGGGGGSSYGGGGSAVTPSIISGVINKTYENITQTKLENEKGYAADVEKHWAKEYVKNVLENDIMMVDSEKKFYPDKKVTRSEIIKYLFKTMKYTETEYKNEFTDVSADADYSGALQTFVDKGIISKDVLFRPDDNVSRQEVCKILSIMLGMGESDVSLEKYADKDLIGDWAVKHVKNMISAGMMVGVSENEFSPHTSITNAQMAKIISVILSGNYVEEKTPVEDDSEVEYIDLSSDEFRVAFIGGSLTELGKEWQEMTIDALEEKLPGKKITYVNKGLGGTGSSYGAPRFQRDILSFEPDLVFIEFAANDRNLADETKAKMYMEQMVRMCQNAEKVPAIVFLFAPTPTEVLQNSLENWQSGVEWKSEVAEHYGIKTVNIQEYTFRDYETHKKANPNYTMTDYYIEYSWKQTGENSFDIHGGYVKYGEAIREAISEDFNGFIRKSKLAGVHCVENETVTEYEVIEIDDPRLTFKGNWKKREQGFVSTDGNLLIADKHFPYFTSGIMQNDSGNASIEFTTDAAGIELQIISSKVGNSATVLIDGVEAGKVGTKNSNTNMNYPTGWIDLPDDGKEHQVRIEVDEITDGYVFNVGSIMTRRYVK